MQVMWHVGMRKDSGGQEVSLGSSFRVHLKWFGLPTADRDWLPIARQKRLWRDLIGTSGSERAAQREESGQSDQSPIAHRSLPRRAARGRF